MMTIADAVRPQVPAGVLAGVQLRRVSTLEDMWDCARWVGERRDGPLCFDTESGGLDPHRHRLRLIQLGDKRMGWAFPPGWFGPAVHLLENYRGELGNHNSPYDNRVLMVHTGYRPRWERTHDSLIATHLHDSLRPADLKTLGTIEVDPWAAELSRILEEAKRVNHWTWDTVPGDYPAYWMYGALDPVLTAWIWEKRASEATGIYAGPYDLERAVARIAAGMMTAGMAVDEAYVKAKISQLTGWVHQAGEWLARYHGITSVNSNTQLGDAFERAGIKIEFWTKTGQPQMDKDALSYYALRYPDGNGLVQTVTRVRKALKIVNDFLGKFLVMRGADGRVHASIHTCRARTARMSVTDPPLQTLDRDEPVVRGAFVPSPGRVFVTVDADQIEARLTAHFSQSPAMIKMFLDADATGRPFFRQMMSEIYHLPFEETSKSDPRYATTKNASYSWVYGAGPDRMAKTAGVTLDGIMPVHSGLNRLYPQVPNLMNQLIRTAREMDRPAVTTPLGRKLYCERGHEYSLLNTLIQGHAGEILKQGAVKLDAAGYGPYLRMFVHDEFILEVPREAGEQVLRHVSELLTDRETYRVPITWAGAVLEERWKKT